MSFCFSSFSQSFLLFCTIYLHFHKDGITAVLYNDVSDLVTGRSRQCLQAIRLMTKEICTLISEIKADICTALLSNKTSTAPFCRCLQNVVNISLTKLSRSFVQAARIDRKSYTQYGHDMLSGQIQGLRSNIFIACRRCRFS